MSRLLQSSAGSARHVSAVTITALATFVVTVIRRVQSSPRFSSIVDFSVLHCHRGTSFGAKARYCDLVFLHRSPAQCLNRLGIPGSDARCELKWPPQPILVFTSECMSFTYRSSVHEWCCDLRHSCDFCTSRATNAYMSALI